MDYQNITTKVCSKCKIEKQLSEYQKDKSRKFGVQKYCKSCRYLQFLEIKDSAHYKEKTKKYNASRSEDQKKYRELNREKCNKNSRLWAIKNINKRAITIFNYSSKRRAIKKEGDSSKNILNWVTNQKKICYWCNCKCESNYHIDHYEPLSKGGKHVISNLVIACASCNLKKNSKDPYLFALTKGRLF